MTAQLTWKSFERGHLSIVVRAIDGGLKIAEAEFRQWREPNCMRWSSPGFNEVMEEDFLRCGIGTRMYIAAAGYLHARSLGKISPVKLKPLGFFLWRSLKRDYGGKFDCPDALDVILRDGVRSVSLDDLDAI